MFASLAIACGGSSPTGPGGTPTPPPGTPVSGFVFYDENGNGVPDPGETVRLPGVTVVIGAQNGQSTAGGRFTVDNVPAGTVSATARPDSVPAYFNPGTPVNVTAPQTGGDVAIPVVLGLTGRASPNQYVAFGDSITSGDGSSGGGYPDFLLANLRSYWGKADMINDGLPGSKSNKGENRVGPSLSKFHPAYLLILYGTNDYNDAECRSAPPCYTVDALRSMVQQTRDAGAEPVLGTIPPVNPAWADRNPDDRNAWVRQMNQFLRTMAAQEHVSVAEVYGDLMSQPSLPPLFSDDKHPNDTGYQLIARSFFNAITQPYQTSSSGRRPHSLFRLPFGRF